MENMFFSLIVGVLSKAATVVISVVVGFPLLLLFSWGQKTVEGFGFQLRSFTASQTIFFGSLFFAASQELYFLDSYLSGGGVFGAVFDWFFCFIATRIAMRWLIKWKNSKSGDDDDSDHPDNALLDVGKRGADIRGHLEKLPEIR